MSVDAGTAVLKVRPDMAGLDSEVSSGIGGIAKKAAGLFAAAFVVTKSIDFFKSAVDEAREAQKVGAQTAAVIASTGGAAGISAKHVEELASKLSTLDGVDREAIASSENLLLTFSSIKGINFDRATASVQDMAAALGEDAKSASIQLGKALNDPIKGIGALRRVGIQFTDDQKKVIESMVKTGNVAGAQGIILDEVAREFGGSAAAQADPIKRLGIAWDNIKRQVGEAVLPVLEKAATWLADKLPAALAIAGAVFGKAEIAVHAFIDAFREGDVTSNGWVGQFERLGAIAHDVFARIRGFFFDFRAGWIFAGRGFASSSFVTVFGKLGAIAHEAFTRIRQGFADFVFGWQNAGAKIGPEVDGFTAAFLRVGAIAHKVWTQIQDDVAAAWAVVGPIFTKIGGYLEGHLKPILFAVAAAFGVLTVGGVIGLVVSAISSVIGVAVALVGAFATPVVVIGALVAGVVYAYTQFKTFRDIVGDVVDFFKAHPGLGIDLGAFAAGGAVGVAISELIQHWQEVKPAIQGTVDWLQATAVPDVVAAAKAMGKSFADLADTARTDWPKIREAIGVVVGWMESNVAPVVSKVVGFLLEQFGHLTDWAQTEAPKVSEAFRHITNVIQDSAMAIGGIVGAGLGIALFIWDHAHEQIKAIAGAAWANVTAFARAGVEILKDIIDAALSTINGDWGAAWADIRDIFSTIWDTIISLAGNSNTIMENLFSGAMAVLGAITEAGLARVTGFFEALPGRVLGALAALPGLLIGVGSALVGGLLGGAMSASGALWGWLERVPGEILSLFGGIGGTLRDAGRRLIQGFIDGIESMAGSVASAVARAIPGGSAAASFLGRIGGHAAGGIIDRPELSWLGEAGREVVIPLTNPARAVQLAHDSGLADLLAAMAGGGSSAPTPAAGGAAGLQINAEVVNFGNDGVIADLDWYSRVRFAGL